jgi:hypothetical protein
LAIRRNFSQIFFEKKIPKISAGDSSFSESDAEERAPEENIDPSALIPGHDLYNEVARCGKACRNGSNECKFFIYSKENE